MYKPKAKSGRNNTSRQNSKKNGILKKGQTVPNTRSRMESGRAQEVNRFCIENIRFMSEPFFEESD